MEIDPFFDFVIHDDHKPLAFVTKDIFTSTFASKNVFYGIFCCSKNMEYLIKNYLIAKKSYFLS